MDESFGEDADQLRRAGLIVLGTVYVQVHLYLKLGDLVHPLRQFIEDDVALVNGISCYKHGLFGVSEHLPHHDARVPVDDAGCFRAGPDEVDQVLGNRAVPAILTEHFEAVCQVP